MALETGTYISDLVETNPVGTDTLDKADDHLRLLKTTIKATFPSITGAVTASQADLNAIDGMLDATNGRGFLRNRIINGDMRIDQRNAGAAVNFATSNQYCVDRWAIAAASAVSGTLTAQRIATSSPGSSQYLLRIARTSGTYTSNLSATQVIETANCYDLAGKTVTLSFRARCGSAYSASGSGLVVAIRTGTSADEGVNGATAGTWAGYAQPGLQTVTLTTSFQTFSVNATLGASVQEIAVLFQVGVFVGTGSANDYVDITDVQLEAGSVATPFERRQYGQELALCQRYYQICTYAFSGNVTSAQTYYANIVTSGQMRTAPTVTYNSVNSVSSFNTGTPTYNVISTNWIVASKPANATGTGLFIENATASAEL